MQAKTTDLCDQYANELQVAAPLFRSYGGKIAFCGPISTVQVYEDNVLVRAALEEPGAGRVLVVDGGGSLRCALVGDQLAALGLSNGWSGIVINGCIRDVATDPERGTPAVAVAVDIAGAADQHGGGPGRARNGGRAGESHRAGCFLGVRWRSHRLVGRAAPQRTKAVAAPPHS